MLMKSNVNELTERENTKWKGFGRRASLTEPWSLMSFLTGNFDESKILRKALLLLFSRFLKMGFVRQVSHALIIIQKTLSPFWWKEQKRDFSTTKKLKFKLLFTFPNKFSIMWPNFLPPPLKTYANSWAKPTVSIFDLIPIHSCLVKSVELMTQIRWRQARARHYLPYLIHESTPFCVMRRSLSRPPTHLIPPFVYRSQLLLLPIFQAIENVSSRDGNVLRLCDSVR